MPTPLTRSPSISATHRRPKRSPPIQPPTTPPYYFQSPPHCTDSICHASAPSPIHLATCPHSLYMRQQWALAAPGRASLGSRYVTRSVVLAAQERRYGNLMAVVGFLVGCVFGVGRERTAEENRDEEGGEMSRSLGEVVRELCWGVGMLVVNLVGYGVSAVYQAGRKVDWGRVWKAAVFIYVAYVWGSREEERLSHLGEGVRCQPTVENGGSELGGPRYMLVEDVHGWSRNVWDTPGI